MPQNKNHLPVDDNTSELEGLLSLETDAPRDVDLLQQIGGAYLKRLQLDLCHAYYRKALAIDPTNGWTHLYLGNLGFVLACYEDAIMHFRRAIELLPGVACTYWCLADVFARQGYWTRTEEYYRRAVEIDPLDMQAKEKLENWIALRIASSAGVQVKKG